MLGGKTEQQEPLYFPLRSVANHALNNVKRAYFEH